MFLGTLLPPAVNQWNKMKLAAGMFIIFLMDARHKRHKQNRDLLMKIVLLSATSGQNLYGVPFNMHTLHYNDLIFELHIAKDLKT